MLGERIAKLRKQRNLSQYELAERLGFSRGKLANYEQGTRQPDYDTLLKIADYFNVSTDFLLGKTDEKNPDKQRINSAYHEYEKLTEEEKDYLDMQLEIYRKLRDKNK